MQNEPFSALLQRFKATELPLRALNTQKAYSVSMAALRTFFVDGQGDALLRSITRGQIEAFLHWRRTHKPDGAIRKTRISGRVIEKDRAMAHNLFAFAERWDLIDSNPVAKTKPPKYDKRQYVILKDDEYERLLTECDGNPFLRLFVLLLGETGMRC